MSFMVDTHTHTHTHTVRVCVCLNAHVTVYIIHVDVRMCSLYSRALCVCVKGKYYEFLARVMESEPLIACLF